MFLEIQIKETFDSSFHASESSSSSDKKDDGIGEKGVVKRLKIYFILKDIVCFPKEIACVSKDIASFPREIVCVLK